MKVKFYFLLIRFKTVYNTFNTSLILLQLIEVQLYNSADTNWLRFNELSEALNAIQQCQMTCFRKYDFKQKFVLFLISFFVLFYLISE